MDGELSCHSVGCTEIKSRNPLHPPSFKINIFGKSSPTNYEALHYAIFFGFPFLPPSLLHPNTLFRTLFMCVRYAVLTP
jgi:hypothetical protein